MGTYFELIRLLVRRLSAAETHAELVQGVRTLCALMRYIEQNVPTGVYGQWHLIRDTPQVQRPITHSGDDEPIHTELSDTEEDDENTQPATLGKRDRSPAAPGTSKRRRTHAPPPPPPLLLDDDDDLPFLTVGPAPPRRPLRTLENDDLPFLTVGPPPADH